MARVRGMSVLPEHDLGRLSVLRCEAREDLIRRASGGVSDSPESPHVLRRDRPGPPRTPDSGAELACRVGVTTLGASGGGL